MCMCVGVGLGVGVGVGVGVWVFNCYLPLLPLLGGAVSAARRRPDGAHGRERRLLPEEDTHGQRIPPGARQLSKRRGIHIVYWHRHTAPWGLHALVVLAFCSISTRAYGEDRAEVRNEEQR